jgi:H(+)-translocating pyrophosphatase
MTKQDIVNSSQEIPDFTGSAYALIFTSSVLGLIYAVYMIFELNKTELKANEKKDEKEAEVDNTKDNINNNQSNSNEDDSGLMVKDSIVITQPQINMMNFINKQVAEGASVFLWKEYFYIGIFGIVMSIIVFCLTEQKWGHFYVTIAFLVGGFTSIFAGYISMIIATQNNHKTAYKAIFGIGSAFRQAYAGGLVMGFFLVCLSLLVIVFIVLFYTMIKKPYDYLINDEWVHMFHAIAGYGLGASCIALFCRVGGGIYTKCADVGADLVAKLDLGWEEDDYRNPACIADNVGDNVGDVAGMGADLFSSMAETLTASMLISSSSNELLVTGGYMYPMTIIAIGIIVSIITAVIGMYISKYIETYSQLEWNIKIQLLLSAILLVPGIVMVSYLYLPETYEISKTGLGSAVIMVNRGKTLACPLMGLASGILIGLSTEYYTSFSHSPVIDLAESCKQGTAINIIVGLALGFYSNIIPSFLLVFTIFGSFYLAGMFGISLAALGMLSNLPICLAIDGFGPIADNAGGIASMCQLDPKIRVTTDLLDAAGNTTAAIGKGFAIGSAALCALSLFGAFITATEITDIDLLHPLTLAGILIGATVPFLFTALTMKAVGTAADAMVHEIRTNTKKVAASENKKLIEDPTGTVQVEGEEAEAEEFQFPGGSTRCIEIATDYSLKEMFLPGAVVIFTPIVLGLIFGPICVAGFLIGNIASGIQLAVSSANSGGAWDNAKKLIKSQGIKFKGLERVQNMIKDFLNKKMDLEALNKSIYRQIAGIEYYFENGKFKDGNKPIVDDEFLRNQQKELAQQILENIKEIEKIDTEDLPIWKTLVNEMYEAKKNNKDEVPEPIDDTTPFKSLDTDEESRAKEIKYRELVKEFHIEEIIKSRDRKSFAEAEEGSIVGDTVGDPLKDTSGPSLNILIKLSAITSVIFGEIFLKTGWAAGVFDTAITPGSPEAFAAINL